MRRQRRSFYLINYSEETRVTVCYTLISRRKRNKTTRPRYAKKEEPFRLLTHRHYCLFLVSHKIKSSNSAENIIGQLRRMPNKSEILIIIPLHYTTYSSYTISVKFELCHISSCLITHTAVEKRGMGSKNRRKSQNHLVANEFPPLL